MLSYNKGTKSEILIYGVFNPTLMKMHRSCRQVEGLIEKCCIHVENGQLITETDSCLLFPFGPHYLQATCIIMCTLHEYVYWFEHKNMSRII
jgi:hypothetical protein